MNKGLMVATLLLLVGLIYWKTANKPGQKATGDQSAKPGSVVEEFSGNLMAAMQKGVPMQCSWESGENKGESFVQGNNVYVSTMMAGKAGYMIKKDNCVWTWGDNQPKGFKFCQNPEQMAESPDDWQPDSGSYQAEGVDWKLEYKCRPAVFGADKFAPPANVEFADFAQMMQGFGQ